MLVLLLLLLSKTRGEIFSPGSAFATRISEIGGKVVDTIISLGGGFQTGGSIGGAGTDLAGAIKELQILMALLLFRDVVSLLSGQLLVRGENWVDVSHQCRSYPRGMESRTACCE